MFGEIVSSSRRPAVSQPRCLVVLSSCRLKSAWVGKNLPSKREDDPQSEGSEAFFLGGRVRRPAM